VGGNGGDGGERVVSLISEEQTQNLKDLGWDGQYEVSIGKGGEGGQIGEPGKAGQDTFVNFRASDGRIIRTISAKGGLGGQLETVVPLGSREVTQEDLEMGLSISSLLIADSFYVKNGVICALGIACERWLLPTLPHDVLWPIACTVSFGQVSVVSRFAFFIVVENPIGKEVLKNLFVVCNEPIRPVANVTYVCNLPFHADTPGIWKLKVFSGLYELANILIEIKMI
jgi:hypothetical protein